MSSVTAQESLGANSPRSSPKNSVAPATTMLPKSPPSHRHFFTTSSDNILTIPPLNAERFNGSFRHFCSVKGLVLDREPLQVGEKEVDLHSLHKEVMRNRGYDIGEERPGFWLKIGQQLNVIRSPDASSSSTEVADQLAMIYKRYLEHFDAIYVVSFMQELHSRQAHAKLIG